MRKKRVKSKQADSVFSYLNFLDSYEMATFFYM
jgi:hypothetical protein